MPFDDTSIGGPAQGFPSTVWSRLEAAGDPSHPEYRKGLEYLLTSYWKPTFAYIRLAWRKPVEDAKDLTQAFFARLLEKSFVAGFHPERGSFRGYLKQALKYFLINSERDASVRKPQGPLLSLEATSEDLARIIPASPQETPDQAYDRQWFNDLVESAIRDMEATLARDGKEVYARVFSCYLLQDASHPSYAEVAARLGIRESDVRNYLHYCRDSLRKVLRERIRAYVETDSDVERELNVFLNG
jgi:RNA polymerase sigma-70 factor (ECF subfamily)